MASSRPAYSQPHRTFTGATVQTVSTHRHEVPHTPRGVPTPTCPAPERAPDGWSLDSLSGRFLEISSWGQTASITAAASLIIESQHRGEPAAWVSVGDSTFFPPDFADCGIDLDSLPVVRVPHALAASRAGEQLLRSGGFGVIVIDLGQEIAMRIAVQARLAALARTHRTILACLTQKQEAVPSLGPLVSLRVQGVITKTSFNRFTWELEVLRDKRFGAGWRHAEVCRGPDGLC